MSDNYNPTSPTGTSSTTTIVWTPSAAFLGTVTETQNFNYGITCYIENSSSQNGTVVGVTREDCKVVIEPHEQNPQSIIITDDVINASISGHYGPQFNDVIRIMHADYSNEDFDTLNSEPQGVSVWDKLDSKTYAELIGFNPDPIRRRLFHYTAKAYKVTGGTTFFSGHTILPDTVLSTKEYIIELSDQNWEPGKMKLKEVLHK